MESKTSYRERIAIGPKVHFGKPCVVGTRITVADVLELIQEGIPFKQIAEEYYPDLEVADIKACAEYAVELIRLEEIHVRVV
jgi:Uncharacterized conserved protein